MKKEEEENKTVVAQPPQKRRKRWEDIEEPGAAKKSGSDWDVPHSVIPVLFPLLKDVCQSKKSWETRHTGIKIVQEIAILDGHAVLPYLRSLVEIIQHGLTDQNHKVRKITALSLAALAQAAAPYGKGSFDSVLKPLSQGIRSQRGMVFVAFLKAIGFIIPLMDANYARYFTKEATLILAPGLDLSPDDEDIKKIMVKVLRKLYV